MKVTLLGMGPGAPGQITNDGWRALKSADAVLGAPRLLSGLPEELEGQRISASLPEQVLEVLEGHPQWEHVCIALSGDVGFYSGAKKLLSRLEEAGCQTELLCGISTPQYFAAKLSRPWQDIRLVSGHGLACNVLAEVLNHPCVFFLTDRTITPDSICRTLTEAGLGLSRVCVGEDLSLPEEHITCALAQELCDRTFSQLCAVLVERSSGFRREVRSPGIPDEEFIRGEVPMTKREVRALAMSLLQLREEDILWDVGAGTGSVSVEMALLARRGRVFAVEEREEAISLIEQNRLRFGVYNVTPVCGTAPQALEGLPAPDALFIGGSRGNMRGIMAAALEQNSSLRLLVSAVSVESLTEAVESMKTLKISNMEVIHINASRSVLRGAYHMLSAQNPVFLISGGGRHG